MKLSLSEPIVTALPIIRRLAEHQFQAVFVGGSVRDTVLGRPVKDVDIATSARPEQVLELFEHCVPTGLQHGTVTVIHEHIGYEITTFRQESAYEDHRKPESVLYITELEGDLLRRDFTMNAMAMTEDGELQDPFGGLLDLERRILRCVGNADARFQEDALRMLRAIRFIGAYGLTPAFETWKAIISHRELLKYVAMERVGAELDKMVAGEAPVRALHFIAASGLLLHLKEPFPSESDHYLRGIHRFPTFAKAFARLNELHAVDLRWAAIGIGLKLTNDAAAHILRVLRFSNHRSKSIAAIIAAHHRMYPFLESDDESKLRQAWIETVIQYGEATAEEWLEAVEVIGAPSLRQLTERLARLNEWMKSIPVSTLKKLDIGGKDLTSHLSRKAGPWVSDWLNRLLFMAASGELANNKTALLEQVLLWDNEVHKHQYEK
ncbi:tRNA nucleotidyltransferase (CCA-adding enzyme) [Paenibacillus castaneae]|uniref:CCA tRNA nucleotidyltransferase n=1 Tax=Paenibacillus castaneae TaxID=474957 RepID=UPI000C9A47D5|nr:CCA tRNA nucleotidyltransferase [Paenibacillus castaneae]NIK77636.1 tRNA nucleotidyltransferase (CCA-adding enzyme) [Paenibacillus castaneae]